MSDHTHPPTLTAAIEALPTAGAGGYSFIDAAGAETALSFAELYVATVRRDAQLRALELSRGERVAVVIPDAADFVPTFLGTVRAGGVPVPLYPPAALGRLDAYLDNLAAISRVAAPVLLCTVSALVELLSPLRDRVPSLRAIVAVDALPEPAPGMASVPASVTAADTAFLQFTSGSTAQPKGVVVTHGSLAANTQAIMRSGLRIRPNDSAVSWLPLYHDMGLIGFVLAPVFVPTSVTFLPTLSFLRDPQSWFDWIDRKRATITFAPNFAYALVSKRVRPESLERWDLSCLRVLGCGAEPINPATMAGFLDIFRAAGVRAEALVPCYGMAEATLAMAFAARDEPLRVDRVDAAAYRSGHRADPATGGAFVEFVGCGRPPAGHEIAVVDAAGRFRPERAIGEIVFRGPSVTGGYFQDPVATARAFGDDGWLRTGDLGYLAAGEIFVTGRQKDVLVIRGRNTDPQRVEWAAEAVPGVRAGNVVAFSRPGADTEELVVALERNPGAGDDAAIARAVGRRINEVAQLAVADLVLLAPGTLPKTSSGKVQRARARHLYLAGDLGRAVSATRTVARAVRTVA
jgi:fatty-acyl-CoA synthase